MDKIKINDMSKLSSLKEIIENQLTEMSDDYTPEEIIKALDEYFQTQKDKDNFKKIIEVLPPEVFEKIFKRLRSQLRKTLAFIKSVVEEEKGTKDSGIQIKREPKDEVLEKKIEDKKEGLKQMMKKINQSETDLKAFYTQKMNEFFTKYTLPPVSSPHILIVKHTPEEIVVDAESVINLFITKKEEQGKKLIDNLTELFNQTNEIKVALYNDYRYLEQQLFSQRENVEIIKNAQNKKEKHLIDNHIMF